MSSIFAIRDSSSIEESINNIKNTNQDPSMFTKNTVIRNSRSAGLVIGLRNILDRYWEEMVDSASVVSMSDEDLIRYKYNPRLYSAEVLGNVHYWSLLLKLNGMILPTDFDKKTIRIPSPRFNAILNEVFILEEEDIDLNREKIRRTIDA